MGLICKSMDTIKPPFPFTFQTITDESPQLDRYDSLLDKTIHEYDTEVIKLFKEMRKNPTTIASPVCPPTTPIHATYM